MRPVYVEFMIAVILGEGWRLVSADWAGWDLENAQGARVEVKQSAARQTWTDRAPADLFVFAWHRIDALDEADHRSVAQWQFFIVPEDRLPPQQKTIGLSGVRKLAEPARRSGLRM